MVYGKICYECTNIIYQIIQTRLHKYTYAHVINKVTSYPRSCFGRRICQSHFCTHRTKIECSLVHYLFIGGGKRAGHTGPYEKTFDSPCLSFLFIPNLNSVSCVMNFIYRRTLPSLYKFLALLKKNIIIGLVNTYQVSKYDKYSILNR